MKESTLSLLVSLSVAALVLALLFQRPTQKRKENFEADLKGKEIGIGIAIGAGILVVIFIAFFFYFYSFPKPPNAVRIPQRGPFLNNFY